MTATDHLNRGHAKLGPSSLHRRLACTGSFAAEEGRPDPGNHKVATEGIKAHELLESLLLGNLPKGDEPFDMMPHVMEAVRWVERHTAQGYTLYVEVAVDPQPILLNDECWGTADIIMVKGDHMIVADFKYGRVLVEPRDNPQLLAYAAGAICTFALTDIANIQMTILQPRIPSGATISSVSVTYDEAIDLWDGMRDKLVEITSNPQITTGDHCKYCRARSDCGARMTDWKEGSAEAFKAVAAAEKAGAANTVALLTDAQLSEHMDRVPLLESIIEDLQTEVLARIKKGNHIPGYKLIEGRGGRAWALTEEELRKKFKSMKLSMADYEVVKLGSPAVIEKLDKLTDKQKLNLKNMWERTPGKLKLVTESTRGAALEFNSSKAFEDADQAAPEVPELPSFL